MNLLWDQLSFCSLISVLLTIGVLSTYKLFYKSIKKFIKKPITSTTTNNNNKPSRIQGQTEIILNAYVSFNSLISFMGFFDETYLYGGKLYINLVAISIGYIFSFLILHPFMYDLKSQIKTPYEYLEKRYANRVICRVFVAFIAALFHFSFSTLFLWSCANILSTIFPNLDLWISILIIGIVSGLFSIAGGMIQSTVMNIFQFLLFLTCLLIAFLFTLTQYDTSPSQIWDIAKQNGRINFIDTSGTLQTRYTIWNQIFSLPIPWCTFHGLLMPNFNRYRLINRRVHSRFFLISNLPIMVIVNSLAIFSALLAYSMFQSCDPYMASYISNKNEISIYWMLKVLSDKMPSFTGFCLAAMVAYAIMSHSVGISCSIQIIYNDILTPLLFTNKLIDMSDFGAFILRSVLNILLSALSILYAISFQTVRNSILSLFFLFNNSLNSPILGIFLLSMFNPWSNHFGAVTSFLIAVSINMWLGISSIASTLPKSQELVLNTHGCDNTTAHIRVMSHNLTYYPENPVLYYLYTISSIWYCLFSLLFILIFGSIFSVIYSLIVKRRFDLDSDYLDKNELYLFSFNKHFFHMYHKYKHRFVFRIPVNMTVTKL